MRSVLPRAMALAPVYSLAFTFVRHVDVAKGNYQYGDLCESCVKVLEYVCVGFFGG